MALARWLAFRPAVRPATMTVARDGSDARKAEFDRIFTAYSAPIYNYALRMVGDPDRAADIAQDTFIKAYRKLDTLTDPSATRAWLYRIATNTAFDEMRRRRHTVPLDVGDDHRGVVHQVILRVGPRVLDEHLLGRLGDQCVRPTCAIGVTTDLHLHLGPAPDRGRHRRQDRLRHHG